jgi:hypothetical protein
VLGAANAQGCCRDVTGCLPGAAGVQDMPCRGSNVVPL